MVPDGGKQVEKNVNCKIFKNQCEELGVNSSH